MEGGCGFGAASSFYARETAAAGGDSGIISYFCSGNQIRNEKDQRHNARLFEEHGRQRAPDGTARGGRLRSPFRQRPHGRQGRSHQHLRVHRRRQTGVGRHDPARGGREKRRQDRAAVRHRLPLGTLCRLPARRTPRSGRVFRRPHMGWHRPGAGSRRRPGPGHRTAPLDAQALCLPENLGGLQLEMRLLRHPAHPRRARFRADGGAGGGGAQTRGRRREGTDRHCAGHDLLRALREAPPGRTAAPPVPHRRYRVDTPPLRLPHGIPRRGDRSHDIRAQDLQIPRHPVPAHLRRTTLGHAPPPHQGRSLCAGRKIAGGDPRPGAAHDAAGRLSR